jgi:hypothetical protein
LTDESNESQEAFELLQRFERDDASALPTPVRMANLKNEELKREKRELADRESQLELEETWSNIKSSGIFSGTAIWFWIILSCVCSDFRVLKLRIIPKFH